MTLEKIVEIMNVLEITDSLVVLPFEDYFKFVTRTNTYTIHKDVTAKEVATLLLKIF